MILHFVQSNTYFATDWPAVMSCRIRFFHVDGVESRSRGKMETEKDINLEYTCWLDLGNVQFQNLYSFLLFLWSPSLHPSPVVLLGPSMELLGTGRKEDVPGCGVALNHLGTSALLLLLSPLLLCPVLSISQSLTLGSLLGLPFSFFLRMSGFQ